MKNLATKNTTDFTVLNNGEAFVSQRKLAALLNINAGTVTSYISRSHEITNTINGLDSNSLECAVAYFAMESSAATPEAKELYRDVNAALNILRKGHLALAVGIPALKGEEDVNKKIGSAGIRVFNYHEAGYSFNAAPPPPPMLPKTKIEWMKAAVEAEEALELEKTNHEATKEVLQITKVDLETTNTQLDNSKEYFSIKRVAANNGVHWKTYNWRLLKSTRAPIVKIFDANYGNVNAYHATA